MDDRNDFSVENPNIPSHILVQKQLQDLIAIQKARCSRLEEDVIIFVMYLRCHKAQNTS